LLLAANCTHYGGPLGEGLLVGNTVRCPWHHACFSLRTGEAIRAPALNEIPCFAAETRDCKLFVRDARKRAARTVTPSLAAPSSVVILGGGAAAQAALETLRREGYDGPITVVSADADPPCGRPNLSKEYPAAAERQGQAAALNMLRRKQPFDAVPFFWSMHYDVSISYVGHAESWDSLAIDGSLAVATIGGDLDSLRAERELELMRA
jgi:hypothetical protein